MVDSKEKSIFTLKSIDNLACGAVISQLPEYDVPRLVLSILKYKLELVRQSDEQDSERYPTEEEVQADIQRLEDYIDTEYVSVSDFMKQYDRHLRFAAVERTPQWEDNYYEVEQECDRRLGRHTARNGLLLRLLEYPA